MTPLVSLCVPVYNVVYNIEHCVRSLMEQDYANIEYVFVNDGSTDDSMSLLEKVIADYPRRQTMVHIYHNDRNHGLAYTRRVTIEKAKGEYVACVDSDDWIDTNYISSLVHEALASEADIVDAPYIEHYAGKQTYHPAYQPQKTLLEDCLQDRITHLWGKLIRRELFEQYACFAPEGLNYLEDRLTLLQLCHYAQQISTISLGAYHYARQEGSISFTKNAYHFQCLNRYWEEARRLLESWGLWEIQHVMCERQQAEDATTLMMQCSTAVCRQNMPIYEAQIRAHNSSLSRGLRLMDMLALRRLWGMVSIYHVYIRWKDKKCHK